MFVGGASAVEAPALAPVGIRLRASHPPPASVIVDPALARVDTLPNLPSIGGQSINKMYFFLK